MKNQNTEYVLLYGSIGGYFLMSLSVMLMPIDAVRILAGAMFWLGLLSGTGLQAALALSRRRFYAAGGGMPEQRGLPGLLRFWANPAAKAADLAMVVSFPLMLAALKRTRAMGYICYVLIAVFAFSFCMHCIFNGSIYFYLKNKNRKESNQDNRNRKRRREI